MRSVRNRLSAFATVGFFLTVWLLSGSVGLAGTVSQVDTADGEAQVRRGARADDLFGDAVALGDFNGDGTTDIAVGAPDHDGELSDRSNAGAVFVWYGDPPYYEVVDIGDTDSADFVVYGAAAGDFLGQQILLADLDADGTDDLIMATPEGAGPEDGDVDYDGDGTNDPEGLPARGEVYVLFGGRVRAPTLDLFRPDRSLTRADLWIYGPDRSDRLGGSLSVGDVDGDGSIDLVMGARGGDGPADARTRAGEVYVLLGSNTTYSPCPDENNNICQRDLRNEPADSIIYGPSYDWNGDGTANNADSEWGELGTSVAVGDLNADGVDDIAMQLKRGRGAGDAKPNAGDIAVVYGESPLSSSYDLDSGGVIDLLIQGAAANDDTGAALLLADFDGDSTKDLIMGVPFSDYDGDGDGTIDPEDPDDLVDCGAVAVVWGRSGIPNPLDLGGSGGLVDFHRMRIYGYQDSDGMGESVAVGDMDVDGEPDLAAGAPFAASENDERPSAGEVWIRFGDSLLGTDAPDEQVAFGSPYGIVYGEVDGDGLGFGVWAGDLDNDDDDQDGTVDGSFEFVAGAPFADAPDVGNGFRAAAGSIWLFTLSDYDGDGLQDLIDTCPLNFEPDNTDEDGDRWGDVCDNCQSTPNRDQKNSDGPWDPFEPGDACDDDDDDDLVFEDDGDGTNDPCTTGNDTDCDDNCPTVPNGPFEPGTIQEDSDGDGVGDLCDNCVGTANTDQGDADGDGIGDACDQDDDNDGISDSTDLCPFTPGLNLDGDGDGVGDICDNCPEISNASQLDDDEDEVGNLCDNCDQLYNPDQDDVDEDDIGGACDNCPLVSNVDQADGDDDEVGNLCDNCETISNPDQRDSDGPLESDECPWDDADGDGEIDPGEAGGPDGVGDACDNCIDICNPSQSELSGFLSDTDGVGGACDNCAGINNGDCDADPLNCDTDGDGTMTEEEYRLGFQINTDGDEFGGDACDSDDDNDGVSDSNPDNCRTVPNEGQEDADADGLGDVCDNCPNKDNANQVDTDHDGLGDVCDNCPEIPNEDQVDSDLDGTGNPCDDDDDNDTVLDGSDNCPFAANTDQQDSDEDGIGDVCDFTEIDLLIDTDDLVIYGDEIVDRHGEAVAYGDLNGDGTGDIVTAATFADTAGEDRNSAGEVYIFFGPHKAGEIDLAATGVAPDVIVDGEQVEDNLGNDVAVGDVNGDGTDDLVMAAKAGECELGGGQIGATCKDADGNEIRCKGCGRVYVLYGRSSWDARYDLRNEGDLNTPNADASFIGRRGGDNMGASLALVDINCDAQLDIVMGVPNYKEFVDPPTNEVETLFGAVFIAFGGADFPTVTQYEFTDPDYLIRAAEEADRLGRDLAGGDVDGDGSEDLIIAAPNAFGPSNSITRGGELHIFIGDPSLTSGGSRNLATDPVPYVYGVDAEDQFPSSIDVADVDGDGTDDILAGASLGDSIDNLRSNAGEVYLILGRGSWPGSQAAEDAASNTIYGRTTVDSFGRAVALGDIDGDGVPEIIASAPLSEGSFGGGRQDAGEAIIFAWADISPYAEIDLIAPPVNPLTSILAAEELDGLGNEFASMTVGDVSGDGVPDLIVGVSGGDGEPSDPTDRLDTGEVWIISPSDADGDGVRNLVDNCPTVENPGQEDGDDDGVGTDCDNCPEVANPDQADENGNGVGDLCDCDTDGDLIVDDISGCDTAPDTRCVGGITEDCADNCPNDINPTQADADGDGTGDACETDDDADGFADGSDNCPLVPNANQHDADGDGTGNACSTRAVDLAADGLAVYGQDASDGLGAGGASGDLNSDGVLDLVVGAPAADGPDGTRTDCGAVYVFYGPISSSIDLASTMADVEIHGQDAGDELGFAISIGDLNVDGTPDIIAGAPGGDGSGNVASAAGQVHGFYGGALASTIDLSVSSSSLLYYGEFAGDRLGEAALIYDANGDGDEDLALAGPNAATNFGSNAEGGAVWIIYNENLESVTTIDSDLITHNVDHYLTGADAFDHAGRSLAAGDVDGDGSDDILVGVPDADGQNNTAAESGAVVLITASDLITRYDHDFALTSDITAEFIGGAPSDRIGVSVTTGEVTGDALADILLGVPGQGSPPGASARPDAGGGYLLNGRADWSSVTGELLDDSSDLAIFGATAGFELGTSVRLADFDGDAVTDLLLAASMSDGPSDGRADAGSVVVIDGNRLPVSSVRVMDLAARVPSQIIHAPTAGDELGAAGWLALADLDGVAGVELAVPATEGDGPSDDRAGAGEAWLVAQNDADWDGFDDAVDCEPNDGSIGALSNTGVTSTFLTDGETFSWASVSGADTYAIYRGMIEIPWVYNESCLQGGLTQPEYTDSASPNPGEAFWYDTTASTSGGCIGPMGDDSDGNIRDENPPACP